MVAEFEPHALTEISTILRDRRAHILARIASHDLVLRETFAELAALEYKRSFDECVKIVTEALGRP